MGSRRTPSARRRLLAAGLAAGVLAGAAVGAALFTGAAPTVSGPRPLVLHAAPALVSAGQDVPLTAATFCTTPDAPSCEVRTVSMLVRPAGVAGWSRVTARLVDGAYRFVVPAALVPAGGFAYWVELVTTDGTAIAYPPGGADAPVRVVTTRGLPERTLAAFDWERRAQPTETVARLRYGGGDGRVGVAGGGPDEPLDGPSSFEVASDGDLVVVDWVHDRIQRIEPGGGFAEAIPLPAHAPMDVALTGDGYALTTLGMDAVAYELDRDGVVIGRYPVGYGIATRVATTGGAPRVLVGHAQWAGVRGAPGMPLDARAQARMASSTIPLAGGDVGVSDSIDRDTVAFVWTRTDGSRAGAVVHLPPGVLAGTDYFVRPLADGGALAARGLWDATHAGIGLLRFDATGRVRSFALLGEPTIRMAAHASVARFGGDRGVYVAFDEDDALRIDRFEVG